MTPDPNSRYLEQRDNARLAIIRQAVIYVPSGLLVTGLLVAAIMALPGSVVAVVLLSIAALAVDMEAYQGTADLFASGPITSRGTVDRIWTKGRFLFFGRVRYLLVDAETVEGGSVDEARRGRRRRGRAGGSGDEPRKTSRRLFEIGPLAALELEPGDEVEVVHWPHTNVIVTLEKLRSEGDPPTQQRDPATGSRPEQQDERRQWPGYPTY